jgi:hypothetical protein
MRLVVGLWLSREIPKYQFSGPATTPWRRRYGTWQRVSSARVRVGFPGHANCALERTDFPRIYTANSGAQNGCGSGDILGSARPPSTWPCGRPWRGVVAAAIGNREIREVDAVPKRTGHKAQSTSTSKPSCLTPNPAYHLEATLNPKHPTT